MSQDRRKYVRREVNYPCWLGASDATEPIKAQVRNISEGGVKIVCRSESEVPDTVDLYLTVDRKVGRRCKVVWRAEGTMGLMFLARTQIGPNNRIEV